MTKRSTRHSLILSAISLLLCASMLIGTTFAWFTDSVTSTGNIIKSGTLDVSLEYIEDAKTDPQTAADTAWKDASEGAIFNYSNWEPGFVQTRHIKIENEGTLALKYKVNVIPTGETEQDGVRLSDVIDVYYLDPGKAINERTDLDSLTPAGTLTQMLAGLGTSGTGTLKEGEKVVLTIALKMQESAGNEYQNKKLGDEFAVQLLATQVEHEDDSFDDTYDKDSEYGAVEYNSKPWYDVGTVTDDVLITSGTVEEYAEINHAKGDLTIKNVTFKNGLTIYKNNTDTNGTVILENCTIMLNDGTGDPEFPGRTQHKAGYGLNLNLVNGSKLDLVFKKCTFTAPDGYTYTGSNSYNVYIGGGYSANSISFEGCNFEGSGKHGIGCSSEGASAYYTLSVKGCNFKDWNNDPTITNGAAIRGNLPASDFNADITISGNTFGNSNGSTQTTVAIDSWTGEWN